MKLAVSPPNAMPRTVCGLPTLRVVVSVGKRQFDNLIRPYTLKNIDVCWQLRFARYWSIYRIGTKTRYLNLIFMRYLCCALLW
jgi:hypothetical protein